jgi:hypothetical protein
MLIRAATAVAVVLCVAGCASSERITEGVYTNANGGVLTVRGKYIDVQIPRKDSRPVDGGTRVIYDVRPDGGVHLYGSSNSEYYLNVVHDWEWHWTGMEIQTRSRSDGSVVMYTRQKQRPY